MHIGFDITCLDHERISGVGTYARNLAIALNSYKTLRITAYYKASRARQLEIFSRHWPGVLEPLWPILPQFFGLPIDIYHGPDFRIPKIKNVPRVVTIHDMAVFEDGFNSDQFKDKKRAQLQKTLVEQNPEAIIAVSHFTKHEICRRFPDLEKKITTVWHGADHLLLPANKGPRPIPEPYFLFVGNLENRKNLIGLIKGFVCLKAKPNFRDVRLVLVGKPGFGFQEILDVAKSSPHREHILLPGFIPNIGLVNYYQWAEAFVYPSHYEGFGFPVIEAMRLGCPVITSNTTATAEVAKDNALLVDANDPESIGGAMEKISSDLSLREDLIRRGRDWGKTFTWEKCAQETLSVYKSL